MKALFVALVEATGIANSAAAEQELAWFAARDDDFSIQAPKT